MTDRAESRGGFRGFALASGSTCLLAGLVFLISWGLAGELYGTLSASIRAVTDGREMVLTDLAETSRLYTGIAAAATFVVSSPWVLGIWLYFAGGRSGTDSARATILAAMLSALGVAFGWFVGFPLMARSRDGAAVMEIFGLFLVMVASMAFAFQIPAISYGFSRRPPGAEDQPPRDPEA